jgi:tetratricopeptide (TPR) repeat protein
MPNGCISTERILGRLDEYLHKNDYDAAERHLKYWLAEAEALRDTHTELLLLNEMMGLYRKISLKEEALRAANSAMHKIDELNISHQVGAATSFLNCATVYKAFGLSDEAIAIFERARAVYERELEADDSRLGGLYNNMALALVDTKRFDEAKTLYGKAISVMEKADNGAPELAITYLNLASAAEAELGLLDADETIQNYLDIAESLLTSYETRDGNYAFVCEKCASVFDYYGRFFFANELKEKARKIYSK